MVAPEHEDSQVLPTGRRTHVAHTADFSHESIARFTCLLERPCAHTGAVPLNTRRHYTLPSGVLSDRSRLTFPDFLPGNIGAAVVLLRRKSCIGHTRSLSREEVDSKATNPPPPPKKFNAGWYYDKAQGGQQRRFVSFF